MRLRAVNAAGAGAMSVVSTVPLPTTMTIAASATATIPAAAGPLTVQGNLVVSGASGNTWLSAYPCDAAPPTANSIYAAAGQTVTAWVSSATSATGTMCVANGGASSITATWYPAVATSAITSTNPTRFDTNTAGNATITTSGTVTLAANTEYKMHLGASSAGLTVIGAATALPPTGGAGTLSMYACQATPATSAATATVTFKDGLRATNSIPVKADAAGDICFITSGPLNRVTWDQSAATPTLSTSGPVRTWDSSAANPSGLAANTGYLVDTGVASSTVYGAAVTVPGTSAATLDAYPSVAGACPAPANPRIVDSVAASGQNRTSTLTVRTDANGRFCIRASAAVTKVLFDRAANSSTITSAGMVAPAAVFSAAPAPKDLP